MRMFHRFKGMLFCSLLCGIVLSLASGEAAKKKIEVFIEPVSVRTGETAYYVIRSNDGARNRPLSALPSVPGLRWMGGMSQSSRVSIVNGKRSSVYEVRIPFVAEKAASYTIPAVNLSHAKEKTPPLTFTVQESTYTIPQEKEKKGSADSAKGETLTLSQLLKVDLAAPGKRKFYYLGEVIPLDIYVHALQNVHVELSWPKLLFSDPASALLLDYRKINPENPSYAGVVRSVRTIRNKRYESYRFTTAFRALSAGKMSLTAEENAAFTLPDDSASRRRNRSADDLFDEFWGGSLFTPRRQVVRNVKSTPLSLEIRKLPPVPQGVFFTGLVGEWKCQTVLSAPPYKVGEPMTITIRFELAGSSMNGSSGSSALLKTPVFRNSLFRSYTPEMEKKDSSAVIRYVLIPTAESDGKKVNLKIGPWATFDPVSSRYIVTGLEKALTVEKGSSAILPGNSMPVVVDPAGAASAGNTEKMQKNRNVEEVLYLKKESGNSKVLPLWKNALAGGVVLLLISAGFLFLSLILSRRRDRLDKDPGHIRRTRAKKLKKDLLKRIASSDLSRITGEYSGEIASYLADACNLESGSDLMDCAASLQKTDPELSAMLSELADCVWSPGKRESLPSGFRERLVKRLGKVCCLALLLLPLALPGADSPAGQKKSVSVPVREEDAMRSYDKGQFSLAAQYYKNRIRQGHISAALLYNLGNCYYKMGKLHPALICYERALRLDSRDPDILENLNLVRRKLGLAERYRIQSPADTLPYLRDMLTMDEWLLMIFMGIGTLLAAGGYFLLCGDSRSFRVITSLGICWALLSFWAFLAQNESIYNPDQALVMQKDLKVYTLPSEEAGKVEMKLPAGEEVLIVERRMEWLRIRSGNAEGWVRSAGVMPLWNRTSMQDLAAHSE